jgi:hypothetical protein
MKPLSLVLPLLIPLLFGGSARAFEISAFGGYHYAAPTESILGVDQGWTGSAGVAYGIAALLPLFETPFSLESGVFLYGSASERNASGVQETRKTDWTSVPVLLHFHFDSSVSIGAGGYAAFSRGMVSTASNGINVNQAYDTAQIQTVDAGLLFDLRARFRISPAFCLVLDGRYQHGLRDLSTITTKTLFTRSVQALAGIAYDFN